MRLIAGLGNPGPEYESTRHNVGFLAVDRLAERFRISLSRPKGFASYVGNGRIDRISVLLAKPSTYMNVSGRSIREIALANRISPEEIVIVHDDIDLKPGTVKWKIGGGDAGHRGIRSVAEYLETEEFARVRIGVGRPPEGVDPAEYVLSPFLEEELEIIRGSLDKVVELIRSNLNPAR